MINKKYSDYICLTLIYIFTIAFYKVIGVPFVMDTLFKSQLADPELLRTRLLETVFYMHGQPPLYNFYVGIVLKLFHGHEAAVFQTVNLILGLLFYFLLFNLMLKMRVNRTIAFILSSLFIFSPSFILFENSLFYTLPVSFFVLLSGMLLFFYLDKRQIKYLWLFFFSLFVVSAMRSIFHFSYFAAVVVLLIVLIPRDYKRILITASVPFLLLISIYAKNYVLYGKFANSTWIGMSIYRGMDRFASGELIKKEMEAGNISPLAVYEPFQRIDTYPKEYQDTGKFTGIPILNQAAKAEAGWENFHHYGFIKISDQFLKDGKYLYTHYPKIYLKRYLYAWFQYLTPSHRALYMLVVRDNAPLTAISHFYEYAFYGKIPFNVGGRMGGNVDREPFVFLILGLPALLLFALWMALKKNTKWIVVDSKQRIMLLYMALTIGFIAFVGNLLEIPENNRFRFTTDSFYTIILGMAITFIINRLQREK